MSPEKIKLIFGTPFPKPNSPEVPQAGNSNWIKPVVTVLIVVVLAAGVYHFAIKPWVAKKAKKQDDEPSNIVEHVA